MGFTERLSKCLSPTVVGCYGNSSRPSVAEQKKKWTYKWFTGKRSVDSDLLGTSDLASIRESLETLMRRETVREITAGLINH